MTAYEVLEKSGWCQGFYAKNAADEAVPFDSSDACSFCLVGALRKAYGRNTQAYWQAWNKASAAIYGVLSGLSPSLFNDAPTTTKEAVLDVLRKAGV